MAVQPIPEGFHTVTPYFNVRGAAAAMDFYAKAFGATEVYRLTMPDGTVAHAELQIGGSRVMLADENAEWGNLGPESLGGASAGIMLYVEDVDASFAQAVAAGATVKDAIEDQFYGDRMGSVTDPYGHKWMIATHKEDIAPAEIQKRMETWLASMMPAAA